MAARGEIFHNENLGRELPPFEYAGENVGVGNTCDELHAAFFASSTHRSVMLEPRFERLGVGAVIRDGAAYVVLDFFTPRKAAASPKPRSSPRPSPRCENA